MLLKYYKNCNFYYYSLFKYLVNAVIVWHEHAVSATEQFSLNFLVTLVSMTYDIVNTLALFSFVSSPHWLFR